jgi:hypothetical protein
MPVTERHIRIARQPLFIDGDKFASFIQITGLRAISVIYALIDSPTEITHVDIFEEAILESLISSINEPDGGGIIDLETFEYRGPSYHYGSPNDKVLEKFIIHLIRH